MGRSPLELFLCGVGNSVTIAARAFLPTGPQQHLARYPHGVAVFSLDQVFSDGNAHDFLYLLTTLLHFGHQTLGIIVVIFILGVFPLKLLAGLRRLLACFHARPAQRTLDKLARALDVEVKDFFS
jgi:hypothetical protein